MINVALFGFGRIGQMHAKNLTKNREIKLLYVYEKIDQLSNKAKKLYGCKIEKNYNTIFKVFLYLYTIIKPNTLQINFPILKINLYFFSQILDLLGRI